MRGEQYYGQRRGLNQEAGPAVPGSRLARGGGGPPRTSAAVEDVLRQVRELQANVSEPLVLAIACNKADMAEHRVVSYAAAAQYAASIGALIFETSAKQNTGAAFGRAPQGHSFEMNMDIHLR